MRSCAALRKQRELYPAEYAEPIHPTMDGETAAL